MFGSEWAINGAFGAAASVMSLALSMEFGFTIVGILAVVGYFIAWACLFGPTAASDSPSPEGNVK